MTRILSTLAIVSSTLIAAPAVAAPAADAPSEPVAIALGLPSPSAGLALPAELSIPLDAAPLPVAMAEVELLPAASASEAAKQKRPWLAAGLNFFFPGAGYIYTGERRLLGVGFLAGAIGLTLVEQSDMVPFLDPGLRESNPQLFGMMFASVFVMNTAFAIDAYQEAKALNEGQASARRPRPTWAMAPTAMAAAEADGSEKTAWGLAFSARY